jgi:DNA-binding XRE family transcriptional regulator
VKLVVSDPIELANAIRAVRKHAGVRLDDMAAAVGVSKQTITNLEAGRCKLSTALCRSKLRLQQLHRNQPQLLLLVFKLHKDRLLRLLLLLNVKHKKVKWYQALLLTWHRLIQNLQRLKRLKVLSLKR